MKERLAIFAAGAAIVLLLALGLTGGVLLGRLLPSGDKPRIADTTAVITQIRALSQLVTVQYVFEKVVRMDDIQWYGQNRLLMIAHGVAKAGVDLQQLKPGDVSIHGTKLTLSLPKPQLFDVYLDENKTEVVERSTGLLRSFDQQMEQEARRQAVEEIRKTARASGILRDAAERTRLQLELLGKSAGFTEVEIKLR